MPSTPRSVTFGGKLLMRSASPLQHVSCLPPTSDHGLVRCIHGGRYTSAVPPQEDNKRGNTTWSFVKPPLHFSQECLEVHKSIYHFILKRVFAAP
jgi:hypothetical protein